MRKARILVNDIEAGIFEKLKGDKYKFTYHSDYQGAPVSLTMPLTIKIYEFDVFPPFFEGLLPEGIMLEALLRKYKIDRNDYFSQLIKVGQDVVGAVTIEELL
jgi:serine/threonine-protein kinase HipA